MNSSFAVPTFPSPTAPAASRTEVHLRYLDYFRAVLVAKLAGLPPDELRASRLPSGWTPLELLKHLTHVEARWLEWGFEGRDTGDPWGDQRDGRWPVPPDGAPAGRGGGGSGRRDRGDPWGAQRAGRWHVPAEESLADLVAALQTQAVRSRAVVEAHALGAGGQPAERCPAAHLG